MNIFDADIQEVIKNFDMSVFDNKTILVTGATGLIGKLCVKSLLNSGYNTQVIALVRNEEKARAVFQNENPKRLTFMFQDINSKIQTERKVDYIIHTASTTASKDFVEKPVETIFTTINGTRNILEFAKNKRITGLVYLSSIEIYGKTEKELISEGDYGYIEILSPRSSYSEGKKLAETMCISYGCEYGVPVRIARVTQTFGAGISKDDNRIFAQFARSVINNQDIVLYTKGDTARNYCYTTDTVTAIFTILTKGENNNAYNIANKNAYFSIFEVAKSLENENTKVKLQLDNTERGFNPSAKVRLDTQKLESLGWEAKVSLSEGLNRFISDFKSQIEA